MKRMTLGLAVAAILMGASSTASAQVINNVCWNVNGFAVKGSLSVAGSASGTTIYDFGGGWPERRHPRPESQPIHAERHRELAMVRRQQHGREHRHVRELRDRRRVRRWRLGFPGIERVTIG